MKVLAEATTRKDNKCNADSAKDNTTASVKGHRQKEGRGKGGKENSNAAAKVNNKNCKRLRRN